MDARGGRATSGAGRCESGHSFDRAETAADGVGDRHPQEQAKDTISDRPEPTRAAIDARTTRRRMGKSGRVASFSKNDRRLAQQRLDRTTRWRERYMLSPHREDGPAANLRLSIGGRRRVCGRLVVARPPSPAGVLMMS